MTDSASQAVFSQAERALERILALWWQTPTVLPEALPSYSLQERFARERHLERLVDQLCAEAATPPRSVASRLALRQRLQSGIASFGRSGLGWSQAQVALLLDGGMFEVSLAFARQARAMDPTISNAALWQAGRNVWIMNGLQLLLGLPVALTPAILAYSLLYPYTDNYLDDPQVTLETKAAFSARFGLRLVGRAPQPANAHEERIWALVAMIEQQYPRQEYPQVHAALQAIHNAQTDSIALLRDHTQCGHPVYGHASPYEVDVLRLSLAKGGASVLADGYLVAGDLDEAQAQALYGLGALLQLADDMQDVSQDLVTELMTAFSLTAVIWPVEGIANRAMALALDLLKEVAAIGAVATQPLAALMRDSILLLMIIAIADNRRLYSRAHILEVEEHSPFPFLALSRARRRLERQQATLTGLLDLYARAEADA